MGDCQTEYNRYSATVIVSLALTLALNIYAAKHRRFVSDPQKGVKLYRGFGVVKVILGVMLLTVLFPGDCAGFEGFYGVVAILIGLYWLKMAHVLNNREPAPTAVPESKSSNSELV